MALIDAANSVLGDLVAPYVLISPTTRYVGTIVADVTLREVHTDEDTITNHPVEGGTPVSDHVFANPPTIEISCGFSDSTGGYPGYVQDVYQEFLAQKATRQTFDVSTGKRSYTSMLFGNITVVTDQTSEFALMVTARLQNVIMTDTDGGASQATPADPSSASSVGDVGNQSLLTTPNVTYADYQSSLATSSTGFVVGGV